MMNICNILIIHPGGIGDLIMFEPCFLMLKNNFPEVKIDIFTGVSPASGQVIKEGGLVNNIISFNWKKNTFFKKCKFIYGLKKTKYDLVIVTAGVNPFFGGFLSYLVGAKVRAGEISDKTWNLFYTHTSLSNQEQHVTDANVSILKAVGLNIGPMIPLPSIKVADKEQDFTQYFLKTHDLIDKVIIGFHPGGGENQKFRRWPKEYFIELGRKIGYNFPNVAMLIFGGPSEEPLCEFIKNELPGQIVLVTECTILQVVSLIGRCNVFVSSDGGLNHIAAALGVQAISMYGPTNPQRTGPRGQNAHIFKGKCRYPLNPYAVKKYDASRHHDCLQSLTPEMVFDEVKKVIDKIGYAKK